MIRRNFLKTLSVGALAHPFGRLPVFGKEAAAAGPLAEHTLAAVETRRISLRWPRQAGKNAKRDVHGFGPSPQVVVLRTDQGALGWGEIPGGLRALEPIREQVLGRPLSELFDPALGILSTDLKPLDFAFHDLAGVVLGMPVWRMLGGQTPHLAPCYSGMIYFDDLEPPDAPGGIDAVLRNCAWDRDHGYRQLKVKIGRGAKWMSAEAGLRRDVEVVRAIAAAFPDCDILVDGNDGFTLETMIAFLKGIGDVPLFWIEEPFVENVADWTALHAWTRANGRTGTLLADGEQHNDFAILEGLESNGILQVRLSDIAGYGFSRWRELLPRLAAQGVQASPHCWGSALKTVYTAHLAAALGNVPTVEGVTTNTAEVDFGGNRLHDGTFLVSNHPGFGLTLRNP
jgi:L-alanine-DL-glutamate epimerase-like enolase superfamily enzyme